VGGKKGGEKKSKVEEGMEMPRDRGGGRFRGGVRILLGERGEGGGEDSLAGKAKRKGEEERGEMREKKKRKGEGKGKKKEKKGGKEGKGKGGGGGREGRKR